MSTPWREVRRALTGPQVAAEVGLKSARQRDKYACPWCSSSDACHVYPERAHCYSCGRDGSVIDLAAAAWGVAPADACRRLAERFGIRPDAAYRRRPRASGRERFIPGMRSPASMGDAFPARAEVYGSMLDLLLVGHRGRAYLAGRGLDPDLAEAHGVRSLDAPGAWRALWRALADLHSSEALEAAGVSREGRPWLPWSGQVPALLLPYRSPAGQVEAVRWRRTTPGPRRYMAPLRAGARIPWRAEAVEGPRPLELVVAEGELDALALLGAGYEAIALGGATPSGAVLEWLVEAVEDVEALALWTDADAAGDGAVNRLAGLLADRYGAGWVWKHVQRWRAPSDPADTLAGAVA